MDLIIKIMRGLAHFNVGAMLALAAWLATDALPHSHVKIQHPGAVAAAAAPGEQR